MVKKGRRRHDEGGGEEGRPAKGAQAPVRALGEGGRRGGGAADALPHGRRGRESQYLRGVQGGDRGPLRALLRPGVRGQGGGRGGLRRHAPGGPLEKRRAAGLL